VKAGAGVSAIAATTFAGGLFTSQAKALGINPAGGRAVKVAGPNGTAVDVCSGRLRRRRAVMGAELDHDQSPSDRERPTELTRAW
jgi:hypothetical protein